jgi:hypothetical protein
MRPTLRSWVVAAYMRTFREPRRLNHATKFSKTTLLRSVVALARQDIQLILFACAGRWKPAKILGREMILPIDNYSENRGEHFDARKINYPFR